jgi:class 3 adenylate cyclase
LLFNKRSRTLTHCIPTYLCVNLAARLEGQSKGGDVVISESLRGDPAVAELLEATAVDVERYETPIKGFDEHFVLYRLMLQ